MERRRRMQGFSANREMAYLELIDRQEEIINTLTAGVNKFGMGHQVGPIRSPRRGRSGYPISGGPKDYPPQRRVQTAGYEQFGPGNYAFPIPMDERKSVEFLRNMKKRMPKDIDKLTLYCPVCRKLCTSNVDFMYHFKTGFHNSQMEMVSSMPDFMRSQVEQAVTLVENERERQKTLMSCDKCGIEIKNPYSDHKHRESHRLRSDTCKAGCVACKSKPFKTFPEYMEHCRSEDHKTKVQALDEEILDNIDKCVDEKDYPEYRNGMGFGYKHVQPVKGYHCRICERFFYTEEDANNHKYQRRHYYKTRTLFHNMSNIEEVDLGEYSLTKPDSASAGIEGDSPDGKETTGES